MACIATTLMSAKTSLPTNVLRTHQLNALTLSARINAVTAHQDMKAMAILALKSNDAHQTHAILWRHAMKCQNSAVNVRRIWLEKVLEKKDVESRMLLFVMPIVV
jgi:hypothetical protein